MSIYEKIFDNTPLAMAIYDKGFNFLKANNAFKNIFETQELNEIIDVKENAYEAEISGKTYKITIQKVDDNNLVIIKPVEDIDEKHSDFISTVSHELRTPLTSIRGFADTLLKSSDKLDEEQKIRFANIIKDQADRLSRLVENLLVVSKLESKKDTNILKPINFKALIDDIVDVLQTKYPTHIFDFKGIENTPDIWADGDKLHRVLVNLIENAAKYSDENSAIRVKTETFDDNVKIKVIDEGVGIPIEHLESIFTKFSRIDNHLTRKVQGSGLGLYITKSLVFQMGGRIKVENNVTNGVTFEVELPIATEEKFQEKFLQSKD